MKIFEIPFDCFLLIVHFLLIECLLPYVCSCFVIIFLFVCLFFPSDPKETFYFSIADEGRVDSSLVHKPEPVMVRGGR